MSELAPDREQLDRFVAALFQHADPDTFLILKGYYHDGAEEPVFQARGVAVGDPARGDEVERWAGVAAGAGRPAAFCPPVCTFRDARPDRRYWAATRLDVRNGVALSEDADEAPQATRAALVALLGPPTLEVASGGVWVDRATGELQDKLHLHWRLTAPTRTPEEHRRLERARRLAAELTGADRTNVPLSHPLRWAGAVHNKGEPRHARIVAETDRELDLGDALAALEKALGDRPVPEGDARGGEPEAEWGDVEAALALVPNDGRTDWHLWKETAMAVYRATAGGGLGLFDAWSAKREDKHDPVACEVAWEQVERSPPDRIGFGSLMHRAREVEPGWRKPSDRTDPSKWFEAEQEPLFNVEGETPRAASAARFVFESFDGAADRALTDPAPFLVKGLLDLGAMSVVYGDSNAGKTFVVMDLEHCIATGRAYAGKRVSQGHVLHIFTEGARGGRKRAEALRRAFGPAPDFHFLFGTVDLFDPAADITPLLDAIKASGLRFVLIVVDTVARAMAGGDENLAKDMSAFVRNVDRLRVEIGAHTMLIHHTGKDAARGARGSSALRAATDTEIEVAEGKITVTKQRDLDKSWSSPFALRVVELGRDEDGDLITSCTVRLGAEPATDADGAMAGTSAEAEEAREISRLVALLRAVEGEPKASVRRLGELAGIPKSTVGKMLDRLKRDRLVSPILGTWELTQKGVKYLADAT